MNIWKSSGKRILMMTVIALLTVSIYAVNEAGAVPVNLQLKVWETYTPLTFGRNLTFNIAILIGNGTQALNTTLNATLPKGVHFVSESVGGAIVTGTPATGQNITWNLGTVQTIEGGFVPNVKLTVEAENTIPDGTILDAIFQVSSPSAQADSSLIANFQVGMKPVEVFISDFSTSTSVFPGGITGPTTAGGTAFTSVGTAGLIGKGNKLGEISGPNSLVQLTGPGGSAYAQGGFHGLPCDNIITDSARASSSVSVTIRIVNPNPFGVELISDLRDNAFAAAGNEAAQLPNIPFFGYPGNSAGVGASAGSGIETQTVFNRKLLDPQGGLIRETRDSSCFPEGAFLCQPGQAGAPIDLTQILPPGPGSGLISQPGFQDYQIIFAEANAFGDSKSISAFDNSTNSSICIVRSGYGSLTWSASLKLMRGDAIIPDGPATLRVTAGSPVEILVTDKQSHRIGFQAAPNVSSPFDAQPRILAEIFGASYSGINSHPQIISIPDPEQSYQVEVLGNGSGTFTLKAEILTINGQVIDSKSTNGIVSPGSFQIFNLSIKDGNVSFAGISGSISGMKFNDINANGINDIGEPGLANWSIILTNQTGSMITMMTDASGNYSFTNLSDGNYTVGEVIKPGWIQTAPAISATGTATYTVNISGGNSVIDKDFGNFHKGKITGGGWINITGDPKATFGIVGQYPDSSNITQGDVEYQDHIANLNIKSNQINSVATTLDKKKGVITGIARVNGAGSYPFVVYVEDNAGPGKGADIFNISLPTYPYINGAVLSGGNIQIHE